MICTCSKNNLLFYGMVPDSLPELPNSLAPRVLLPIHLSKQHLLYHPVSIYYSDDVCSSNIFLQRHIQILQVQDLFRYSLGITRTLPLKKVVCPINIPASSFDGTDLDFEQSTRLTTGPEIRGCRPILVTFNNFKVRHLFLFVFLFKNLFFVIEPHLSEGPGGGVEQGEAAEKVKYLRLRRSLKVFQLGLQVIHFTLCQFDTLSLNRKTREHRHELQKFLRQVLF